MKKLLATLFALFLVINVAGRYALIEHQQVAQEHGSHSTATIVDGNGPSGLAIENAGCHNAATANPYRQNNHHEQQTLARAVVRNTIGERLRRLPAQRWVARIAHNTRYYVFTLERMLD